MTFTVPHGKSPFLQTVNHLFRLGPSKNIPWLTVNVITRDFHLYPTVDGRNPAPVGNYWEL